MSAEKSFTSTEIVTLLTTATMYKKIQWSRLTDYMFYNGANRAILNYATLFSQSEIPVMIDDVPHADLMKSYYCQYEGVAFCIMHLTQVLQAGECATDFYNLMIQRNPYDNFGDFSASNGLEHHLFQCLVKVVELQISTAFDKDVPFFRILSRLQNDVDSFDPRTESTLMASPPSPPCKHSCVVDSDNNYVDYVLVFKKCDADGKEYDDIYGYELKSGERLLDVPPPSGIIRAHWGGAFWNEAASETEIAEYRRNHRY